MYTLIIYIFSRSKLSTNTKYNIITRQSHQHLQPPCPAFCTWLLLFVITTGFIVYFQFALVLVPSLIDYYCGFWARFYSIRFQATFRNRDEMLVEFLAETSMQCRPFFYTNCSTYFLSTFLSRSTLLPTTQINPSCPLVSLTKSHHLSIPSKLLQQLTSITMRQQSASRTYDGINDLNLYCPAVSQSCSRIVSPSICSVLVTKSMPTVGQI